MKCLSVLAVSILLLWLLPVAARAQEQNPDNQYLVIYSLIRQGDSFENSGDANRALEDYSEAQKSLEKFHRVFPDWYPKIVNFRLSYLADKIGEISAKVPKTNAPPATVSAPTNSTGSAALSAANAHLESQVRALREQLKRMQSDNETLQAKLKEALSVQPATVSAAEFARMQQQLRSLMKENNLLKVSLAQGQGGEAVGIVNTQAVAQLKQALADANKKLALQKTRADKLAMANESLEARLKSLMASADTAEALRQENQLLKKQVARLKSAAPTSAAGVNANAELAKARAQIATLQSAAEVSSLEKMALENRVKQLQHGAVPAAVARASSPTENEARIRELEKERNELQSKLGEANKKLFAVTNGNVMARIDALAQQVDTLRARIAVDEAKPVPYTPEELALFKRSTPVLTGTADTEETSINELPRGAASLAAQAQHYYSNKEYGKAEADYQKILSRDKDNGVALANLAAIELEENKLDDADKHIRAALAKSPNDAYNLTVLGRVRFAEAKYDEALDALSRAAKLDPKNPDIQNYLGVTLAEKGLRAQAETALRRAVELDPNYAAAHNNLAVIYMTQKPPMVELARWHYEKALAAGQPHNKALEKLLAEKGAPVSQSQ